MTKKIIGFGAIALSLVGLTGCAAAAEPVAAGPNPAMIKACLSVSNQDGYVGLFDALKDPASRTQWAAGATEAQAAELNTVLAPFTEEWARLSTIDMALTGDVFEKPDYINLQASCLAVGVTLKVPTKVY
jgi:hypothetical protein